MLNSLSLPLLTLFLHEHDPVLRTSNGAADVNEIAGGVDTLDAEMSLRVTLGAIVTRHPLALDDTRRIGAGAHGAGTTVLGVAVGVGTTVESVALDDALEPATLRSAGHLHLFAGGEDLDRDFVAEVVGRDLLPVFLELRVVETEAAEDFGSDGETSLRRMTDDRL